MKSGLPAEPALVGRDQEIHLLRQNLDSALNGHGTTVFICGEAGIGKTRLVNEFLIFAKKMGVKTLSGSCLSGAAIPYFPFTEAFNTYVSTTDDEKEKSAITKELGITEWLKGSEYSRELAARRLGIAEWLKGPEYPRDSLTKELLSAPQIERDRTFEAVARVFLQLSTKDPLIFFLDDLQWADQLSLALLHYLSRKCINTHLLIIGTYRSEEIIPSREERIHPLEQTMFAMSREDLLVKVELDRLKQNDFPKLLESILGSSADEEFVEKLYDETEGNPLFALETLGLLVDESFLSEKEGLWTLAAPLEKIGIPSKVQEVIAQRIARLAREEKELIDLGAVFGFSFSPDMLSRSLALDVAKVLRTLVEIKQRHRLIRSTDSRFEFTHHKIRETIYANMPNELRRIYHLKAANCLEQVLTKEFSDRHIPDLAHHYVEGGALEKAFEYLAKLGEKAVNIFANMQAIEYLNKAIDATQKIASLDTKENLTRIYMLRGRAWCAQGEFTRAKSDFNLLLQNVTDISDDECAEAHYWYGYAVTGEGNFPGGMPHFVRAMETARETGNKLIESRSLNAQGYSLFYNLNTLEEGRKRLEESSRICEEIGNKVTEAQNRIFLGWYHNWRSEFNLAKENTKKGLALAEKLGDKYWRLTALRLLGWICAGEGKYNDAISTIQRCLEFSQEWAIEVYDRGTPLLTILGWIYHDLSNLEPAIEYHEEALRNATDLWVSGMPALVDLGRSYLSKNDYETAEKYFKEAASLNPPHGLGKWRFKTRIFLGLGEISLAKGDYAKALKLGEASLVISEKASTRKYIARSLKLKAEALANMGNLEKAVELMEEALALAQQVGNPPLLWQIHYSLGLLLEKKENPQKANVHYAEAIELIKATALKLDDPSLKKSLLTSQATKTIRTSHARTSQNM
ncbi:MAG: tetratricopeptide repeat protein [Candidatus Bathyarchaeota archaeon]|nr:MAG: tetratricopeptide repeat protein [Candidatus Bathyarchaeota archaeon]